MIMERGGRRRGRAADGCVLGHTVKNRMTVIARWGAIERKREFLKFLGRRFCGVLFCYISLGVIRLGGACACTQN